jgi:fluoride ion exporter CrcB/FEX
MFCIVSVFVEGTFSFLRGSINKAYHGIVNYLNFSHICLFLFLSKNSFTTFSTFSVDVVTWLSEGKTARAVSYVATNNVGGFAAAALGMALMKKFIG